MPLPNRNVKYRKNRGTHALSLPVPHREALCFGLQVAHTPAASSMSNRPGPTDVQTACTVHCAPWGISPSLPYFGTGSKEGVTGDGSVWPNAAALEQGH